MRKEILSLTEEQLAALVASRTREVLDALLEIGPATVPQLQKQLGYESKSVYYQIKKLVRVGLAKESGKLRRGSEGVATFDAAASKISMPTGFQGAEYERLAVKRVAALLRKTTRQFEKVATMAPEDPSLVDDLLILTQTLRLNPGSRKEFHDRLRALYSEFASRPASSGDRSVAVVFVQTPLID